MNITVQRNKTIKETTTGVMYVSGKPLCYTLEDAVRAEKVYGQTAIPAGTYKVVINFSNRFKKQLPQLLDVPGFEGIRIHPGNKKEDTEGCILVGESISEDQQFITNSRTAFAKVFAAIQQAKDPVFITIVDYQQ